MKYSNDRTKPIKVNSKLNSLPSFLDLRSGVLKLRLVQASSGRKPIGTRLAIQNETIEGESVIINLENGFYYSLDAVGAEIWQAIDAQHSITAIIDALASRFTSSKEEISSSVHELITELQKEALIVPLKQEEKKNVPDTGILQCEKESESTVFIKPVLNKFGDMQDLLLLDPIHEVDEAGWPHTKPETPLEG